VQKYAEVYENIQKKNTPPKVTVSNNKWVRKINWFSTNKCLWLPGYDCSVITTDSPFIYFAAAKPFKLPYP
jgi:hypothetical protein